MVNFNFLQQLKDKKSLWISVTFYFFCALLIIVFFTYFIIVFKVYLQNKEINELDSRIATYGLSQQKIYEKRVLDYKKKINDYSFIISNQKISSNVFAFIEARTLPNVWFSSFNMSKSTNEIKLSGESENMETLGRQVRVFEKSNDYISSINVSSLEIQTTGKTNFILSFYLKPEIFSYSQ